jgi:hypothetical protein
VPPYDDRRRTTDVDGPDRARRDGATVGGATGPVADDHAEVAGDDDTRAPRVRRARDEPGGDAGPGSDRSAARCPSRTSSAAGRSLLPGLAVGDRVALHWDWVCDVLSDAQCARLESLEQDRLGVLPV